MPAFERISLWRIVAIPAALDNALWPENAIVLRSAPDEVFVISDTGPHLKSDPHAIIEPDGGFAALWLPATEALDLLTRTCRWELPRNRPAFAQGAVAGIPVKLWLDHERVLFLTPAPYAADLEDRLG